MLDLNLKKNVVLRTRLKIVLFVSLFKEKWRIHAWDKSLKKRVFTVLERIIRNSTLKQYLTFKDSSIKITTKTSMILLIGLLNWC